MTLYFLAVLTLMSSPEPESVLPPPDPIPETAIVPNFTPVERWCIARFLFCTDCVTCGGRCDPIGCYD